MGQFVLVIAPVYNNNKSFDTQTALKFAGFIIGWWGNWSFTVKICSTTSFEKRRRSGLLFTLLGAAGISPIPILNQNAKIKDRASWVPFKI